VSVGERVVVGGAGGRQKSVAARVVAKQEFAGYWEYVVDEAIFTAPSHPNWGGTALIGPRGELIGIGSLQLQEGREQGPPGDINMMVPIDLLNPIFDDLLTLGRPKAPPRPWLGLYATAIEKPSRGGGACQGWAVTESGSAHRRRAAFDRRRRGPRSRRALSQGMVARYGRP
jgi:S1-C subfamily serine protease